MLPSKDQMPSTKSRLSDKIGEDNWDKSFQVKDCLSPWPVMRTSPTRVRVPLPRLSVSYYKSSLPVLLVGWQYLGCGLEGHRSAEYAKSSPWGSGQLCTSVTGQVASPGLTTTYTERARIEIKLLWQRPPNTMTKTR